jgi:hypothetical protein
MAEQKIMVISWLAIFVLIVVVFMIVKALVNPRSRPIVLGLLAVGLAAFVFVGFFSGRAVRVEYSNMQATEEAVPSPQRDSSLEVPGPPPGYPQMHATESMKPKNSATSARVAKSTKPENKPDKSAKPATPPKEDSNDADRQPPAWIKTEPRMQGGVYLMTRQTDPYSTTLECDRDLPKVLQSAVSEYAQLLLGNDQGKNVRLSETELQQLVRDRWVETRTIDIGGETKNMLTLHLLIGFDPARKQRILGLAENVIVAQRLKGAGVVLGGLLGVLALAWAGLRMATNECKKEKVADAAKS